MRVWDTCRFVVRCLIKVVYEAYDIKFLCSLQEKGLDELIKEVVRSEIRAKFQHSLESAR
jgi:hypothetical protein